jgi:parvulin-like peptidyl-prolyl isomerase
MKSVKSTSSLGLLALGASLCGCAAAFHPATRGANEVAPNVPLLWPKQASESTVAKAVEVGGQEAALGVNNGIIAIVGNKAVTLKEFELAFFRALKNNSWGISERELYEQVLSQMIERELLLSYAANLKEEQAILISDQEVEDGLDRRVQNFPGGWEAFRRGLEGEKLSLEDVKLQIKEDMTLFRVQAELMRGMGPPSPRDIQEAYDLRGQEWSSPEKRDISLITVFLGDYKPESGDGQAVVDDIKEALVRGDDFAKVAKRYSDGAKREQGGRQGWVGRADLAEEITKVAFSMGAKAVSGPHRMGELVFYIKCHEIQLESRLPFQEVRDRLEKDLSLKKREERMRKELLRLKSKTHVRKLAPEDFLRYRESLSKR